MNNIFTDTTNKALLWELLEESFAKIDNNDYNQFKKFFENHINNSDNYFDKQGIIELIDKNKYFISDTLNLINNNEWKNKYNQLYTSDDIRKNNLSDFEKRFMERQKEFTNLIDVKKPKEISFDDNKSDKPISNMEETLQKLQLERDQQLNISYSDVNNKSNAKLDENYKKIKILDDSNDVKKKVTFSNLVDAIDNKNEVEITNINDIKNDIDNIKSEIMELKNLLKSYHENIINIVNKDN